MIIALILFVFMWILIFDKSVGLKYYGVITVLFTRYSEYTYIKKM